MSWFAHHARRIAGVATMALLVSGAAAMPAQNSAAGTDSSAAGEDSERSVSFRFALEAGDRSLQAVCVSLREGEMHSARWAVREQADRERIEALDAADNAAREWRQQTVDAMESASWAQLVSFLAKDADEGAVSTTLLHTRYQDRLAKKAVKWAGRAGRASNKRRMWYAWLAPDLARCRDLVRSVPSDRQLWNDEDLEGRHRRCMRVGPERYAIQDNEPPLDAGTEAYEAWLDEARMPFDEWECSTGTMTFFHRETVRFVLSKERGGSEEYEGYLELASELGPGQRFGTTSEMRLPEEAFRASCDSAGNGGDLWARTVLTLAPDPSSKDLAKQELGQGGDAKVPTDALPTSGGLSIHDNHDPRFLHLADLVLHQVCD